MLRPYSSRYLFFVLDWGLLLSLALALGGVLTLCQPARPGEMGKVRLGLDSLSALGAKGRSTSF